MVIVMLLGIVAAFVWGWLVAESRVENAIKEGRPARVGSLVVEVVHE